MDRDQTRRTTEALADLGHLSSGVGHHVINAFSTIVSNAEVYRILANTAGALDPIAASDQIIQTALDASTVARRLIDYTRGATALGDGRAALDRLAAEAVEAGRIEGRPGVEWVGRIESLPPILGDELQLAAMIRHLVDNALEALPPFGGTIAISTGRDHRAWFVLEVRDSGGGMGPEVLEHALEPFFTTKQGRRGVGLSIANGIWRRHHGTLAIQTVPGEGTNIRLCIDPANVGVATDQAP